MARCTGTHKVAETRRIEARRREIERCLFRGVRGVRAIAEHVGASKSTVAEDVREIEREWREGTSDDSREAWRLRAHHSLDAMEQAIGPASVDDTLPLRELIEAQRARLRILDARAKMEGLYLTGVELRAGCTESPYEILREWCEAEEREKRGQALAEQAVPCLPEPG